MAQFHAAVRTRIGRAGPDDGVEEADQHRSFLFEGRHHFLRVERMMRRRRTGLEGEDALFDESARPAADVVELRPIGRETRRKIRQPQDCGVDEIECWI